MNQILYNNIMKKKMYILQNLFKLEDDQYSINHLSGFTKYTQKTILSILNDLHLDFIDLFDYALLSKDQKINWQKDKVDFNKYRQFLMKQSIPYQFVLASILHPEQSLDEFCQSRFLSVSTARRTLSPFVKKMGEYNIQVKLSSMSISGNEFAIRCLYFSILWVGSFGEDLLIGEDQQLLDDIKKHLEHSSTTYVLPQKLLAVLLIAKYRIKAGHIISEDLFLSIDLPRELDFMTTYFLEFLENGNQLHYEYHSFIYFIHYLPFCADSSDPRTLTVLRYLKNLEIQKTPLARLFNSFFNSLKKHLAPTKPEHLQLLKANLFIVFSNFSIQRGKLPILDEFNLSKMSEIAPQDSDLVNYLKVFICKAVRRKHLNWLNECSENLILYLVFFIDPFWSKEEKLNVTIAPIPNTVVLQQLYKILDMLAFVNYSINNKIAPDTDVYISTYDTLSPCNNDSLYLIPYDGLDTQFEKDLFTFLLSKHKQKQKLDGVS